MMVVQPFFIGFKIFLIARKGSNLVLKEPYQTFLNKIVIRVFILYT